MRASGERRRFEIATEGKGGRTKLENVEGGGTGGPVGVETHNAIPSRSVAGQESLSTWV